MGNWRNVNKEKVVTTFVISENVDLYVYSSGHRIVTYFSNLVTYSELKSITRILDDYYATKETV